jgi:nucleoside diphosphate kinase
LIVFIDKVSDIYKRLDQQNFEIFHQKRKILSKEEVLNLFYPYREKEFFSEIEEHMMTAESIILLLINKVETVWSEEE